MYNLKCKSMYAYNGITNVDNAVKKNKKRKQIINLLHCNNWYSFVQDFTKFFKNFISENKTIH